MQGHPFERVFGQASLTPGDLLMARVVVRLRHGGAQGGEGILAKVIDLYLDDSPVILDELRDCVVREDHSGMRKAAHKFKSSSANLGADRLAELCKRLEVLGRSDSTAGVRALLDKVEQEYGSVRDALKELSLEVPA